MAPLAAIPLFLASLAVTLAAARLFARRLDRLGVRFGFPEALIGLLTAVAADGPEVSSALFALTKGAHSVSVGVLVGSNAFNLAAMIGVSGVLAGSVQLARETLLLEGLAGAAITVLAAAVLLKWLPASLGAVLAVCVLVPYLTLVIGGSELLIHARNGAGGGPLSRALAQRPQRRQNPPQRRQNPPRRRQNPPQRRQAAASRDPAHHLIALVLFDVVLIVAGSAGLVESALALGKTWQISSAVLGVLVLAPLTSIPNAITGVRLGLAGRSAALVGETFNSNTINLGAGVLAPALFTTLGVLSSTAKFQLAWLVGMTAICIGLLARPRGISRRDAGALIVLYLGFVAIEALSP